MDPYRHRTNLQQKVTTTNLHRRGQEQRRQEWIAASKYYQNWEVCSQTQKKVNSIEIYEASLKASAPSIVLIDRKANLEARRNKLRSLIQADESCYTKELDELRKSNWKPSTGALPTERGSCFLDTFNRSKPRVRDAGILQQIETQILSKPEDPAGAKELKQLYINKSPAGIFDSKTEITEEAKENTAPELGSKLTVQNLSATADKGSKENIVPEQDENANPSNQTPEVLKSKENVLLKTCFDNNANKSSSILPSQTNPQHDKPDESKEIKKISPTTLSYRRSQLRSLFQSEEAEIAKEFNKLDIGIGSNALKPQLVPEVKKTLLSRSNSKRAILNID